MTYESPERETLMAARGRPRLLDLFCGAGGAAMGYHRAGFDVVGVDINPQPDYPFPFIQDDALTVAGDWQDFDAIHASPPCQAYTTMNNRHGSSSPPLIHVTREMLQATGLPYVIENVPGALKALHNPVRVCGRAVGMEWHRHRMFETSFPLLVGHCQKGRDAFGIYGKLDGRRLWRRADGSIYRAARTLQEARDVMGMPWANWDGVREAVPPAMTEHVGRQLLAHIGLEVAA